MVCVTFKIYYAAEPKPDGRNETGLFFLTCQNFVWNMVLITALFAVWKRQGYLVEKVTQGSSERGGKQSYISSGFMCNPEVMFFFEFLESRNVSYFRPFFYS